MLRRDLASPPVRMRFTCVEGWERPRICFNELPRNNLSQVGHQLHYQTNANALRQCTSRSRLPPHSHCWVKNSLVDIRHQTTSPLKIDSGFLLPFESLSTLSIESILWKVHLRPAWLKSNSIAFEICLSLDENTFFEIRFHWLTTDEMMATF